MTISLEPIGWVRREEGTPTSPDELASRPARIELAPRFREGLSRISPGDELLVLFWMDRADRGRLLVHPRGDVRRPLRGVFATRSPHRPNPIGATTVRVIRVDQERGILEVEGLDALDGTPVLDLKATDPHFDRGAP
ncbi:tRNA (N6-threonylcarbamoyladenosine(37)-N6)-methyltransferase TrmO [Candidatus Acetothermia bacterium]|nr:MAG: tRNA (N6-threonylcarbamoyladenosine(37)-N6)-methyltransferase TrmO [Candidatus Acetothermia bacterium]